MATLTAPRLRCLRCSSQLAWTARGNYATATSESRTSTSESARTPTAFRPARVRRRIVDDMNSETFLACIQQDPPEPLVLAPRVPVLRQKRTVLDMLLDDPQIDRCVVDLELGRYDQPGFEQVQLPLRAYLQWLASGNESGKMKGKTVYLAQWRGLEEMPSIRRFLDPPRFLQNLIKNTVVDLYQASFFVGPTAAITPLHHDPYINLFRLASTSGPYAAKHFLILPPTNAINQAVRPAQGQGQSNTSPLDFQLIRGEKPVEESPLVGMVASSPGQSALEEIKKAAYGVSLKAGEMLLLPHKWWHRVENIGTPKCWTAGVGYWFRTRSE